MEKILIDLDFSKLECSNCKSLVLVNDIGSDVIDCRFDWCPNCEQLNTFPRYSFENISEALKRKS